MAKCSPLHKVTDAPRSDSEDLFGRLCIVAHAAFLYAGLLPNPNSTPATTPWSLSRRYSVLPPQAARRHGEAAVVLRLFRPWRRRRRGRAHMALRAYVTGDGGRHMERRERLGCPALDAILSGGVDDTARTLRAPGSDGAWLWKLLVDGICRGLFLYACERNSVPVMPDFASLPGDIKMATLEKLDDGKDVAMAESASKEMRAIVSDHNSDLWKEKYEAIISSYSYHFRWNPVIIIQTRTRPALLRWKEKYVMARRRSKSLLLGRQQGEYNPLPQLLRPINPRVMREILISLGMIPKPRRSIRRGVVHEQRKPTAQVVSPIDERRAAFEEKLQRRSAARTMTMVPKRSCRREHQAGAVHSPSSRYQWKHR